MFAGSGCGSRILGFAVFSGASGLQGLAKKLGQSTGSREKAASFGLGASELPTCNNSDRLVPRKKERVQGGAT